MKKISLKLIIRRIVLATSFPPFLGIYRTVYKVVISRTVQIFRKFPQIRAVYLRRGSAKGEVIPLLSDIDFAVITTAMDEETKKELLNKYEKLAALTTLLDKSLELYDEESFYKLYESGDYYQYRFMEGKKTWKLIYGADYLAKLPDLSIEKLYGGLYTEIKIWWTIFEWRFFQNRKYNTEAVTRNNTCYKAVAEILKMNLALNKGVLEFNRKKTLELSRGFFKGKDLSFIGKLETISRKNFRSDGSEILDDTKNFILNYLNNFYRESGTHAYLKPLKIISQNIISPSNELLLTENDKGHVNALVNYVKTNWDYTYSGSYLVQGVYFNVDEFLFMVKIDTEKIPSTRELTELNLFHDIAKEDVKSRIKLFLLFNNSAFQINTHDFKMSWQSILTPHFNPDIFELLNRPESKLDGISYSTDDFPVWTQPVEHFLCEERRLFFKLLEDPTIYKLNNLELLRIFWKTLQLVLVNRSVQKDKIVYPLTLPAIENQLIEEGLSFPEELKVFTEAYTNELIGNSKDISFQIPAAIKYLRGLENE